MSIKEIKQNIKGMELSEAVEYVEDNVGDALVDEFESEQVDTRDIIINDLKHEIKIALDADDVEDVELNLNKLKKVYKNPIKYYRNSLDVWRCEPIDKDNLFDALDDLNEEKF